MEAFFVSTGVVFLGEMGDKTQLLALLLVAKFRRPVPIIAGILVATLLNHGFAGIVGTWVATALGTNVLRWVVGLSFLGVARWTRVPDKIDSDDANTGSKAAQRFGVFGTTVAIFFLAEMGDKTQIATIALAARYHDLVTVVAGTTLGMLLADIPAVLFGETVAKKLSMRLVRRVASLIFAVLGVLALASVERSG